MIFDGCAVSMLKMSNDSMHPRITRRRFQGRMKNITTQAHTEQRISLSLATVKKLQRLQHNNQLDKMYQ
jgi:hypothetical protein